MDRFIRIGVGGVALMFVLALTGFMIRSCWLAQAYSDELDRQWAIIDQIVRQSPDPQLKQGGAAALALWNVWGNTMQSEFYPIDSDSRAFSEMRSVTSRLDAIAAKTTESNTLDSIHSVYDLLLATASYRDFVARYRDADYELIDRPIAEPADSY